MKNIIKTFGLFGIFAAIPGAFAATSRVGMVANPATRLPSIAGYIVASGTTTSTGSTTASSLLSNAECIESYSSCIKGADACGAGLEECTTNVLFHGKMANCLNVLAQCSSSGVNDLFGTSSIAALATVKSTNAAGEVTEYTYPTAGSVLGQMITGAAITNRYDTAQCVKKYTSCLKKDSVCGNDFELCTTNTEFKKQAVFCMSTLARCDNAGIVELYGSSNTSMAPAADSRLGTAISEGAALAAVNAVSTCYKVADQCILGACGANPNKCIVDSSSILGQIAEAINNGGTVTGNDLSVMANLTTSVDVSGYLKNVCLDTIGGNKYCYATFVGNGQMPTNAQLRDEDNRDEVFSEAYSARMNDAMKQRIRELANKFDTKAKDKCSETIKTCAMRSCGEGLGSLCYNLVFMTGTEKSINGHDTYAGIRTACEPIVNADTNCQYAAATVNNTLYTYNYTDASVFTTLFPEYEQSGPDPIGVVGALNASLSTSYNDAAIANMRKQCANTAISCVKSMCGKDYTNCYRNRTDVMGTTYDTGEAGFDKSMNKVGGVLDYTIVSGLCVNTVKSSGVCEEHLKIESYKLNNPNSSLVSAWGGATSTRDAWLDSAKGIKATRDNNVVTIGCTSATGGENCDGYTIEACDYIDEDGCLYDQPVTQPWAEYSLSQSADNLFREVLIDIEKEAQAKYNAKLTKEQNVCLAKNEGGIRGSNENGSTYMWVKLKSNKIPKDYPTKGLQTKNFTTSNDLYGSFCRLRITVTSDDKTIQDNIGADATAYFAVGDTFTCGSWISQATLDKITKAVGEKARKEAGEGSAKEKAALAWSTVGGFLAGGLGGYFGMDALQSKGGSLGGLLGGSGKKQTQKDTSNLERCISKVDAAKTATNAANLPSNSADTRAQYLSNAVSLANEARSAARSAGVDVKDIDFAGVGSYLPGTAAKADTYKIPNKEYEELLTMANEFIIGCAEQSSEGNTGCNMEAKDCKDKATILREEVKALGDFRSTEPIDIYNKASLIYTSFKTLQADVSVYVAAGHKTECAKIKAITIPGAEEVKSKLSIEKMQKVDGHGATDGALMDANSASANLATNLNLLGDACQSKQDEMKTDSTKRRNINLIAGAATSVVGTALGAGIAKTVLDIKYENAENAAIKEWMEQIGEHIQCYVGAEEAGTYGDVININYD